MKRILYFDSFKNQPFKILTWNHVLCRMCVDSDSLTGSGCSYWMWDKRVLAVSWGNGLHGPKEPRQHERGCGAKPKVFPWNQELFRKKRRNQGPAAWAARAVRVYFKSKPLDNFFLLGGRVEGVGENHKDSNSRICKIVTPHLASVIREWGVPHKWVFQIIELYSPKSQGLKEINRFDSKLSNVFVCFQRLGTQMAI